MIVFQPNVGSTKRKLVLWKALRHTNLWKFPRIRLLILLSVVASGTVLSAHASDSATYIYDTFGRVWTVTYANGTVITYTYDNAGNRQQVVTSCSANGC